ncbi:hypothetical protein IFM89_016539 [Coptis chinensis]|uniref:Uncharacterized protein n=1 Tax=Coptis chinensis TaxID=261450 RepID=A0A835INM7_9MAGN|nr:hypothetical protein IFM89_016539 [Coptis chinensis]
MKPFVLLLMRNVTGNQSPWRRLSLRLEASRLAPKDLLYMVSCAARSSLKLGCGKALFNIDEGSTSGLTENDFILASKINALDVQHLLRRKAAN